MRLTSSMWFAAYMRREQQNGAFVTVLRSGSSEAGAIFVIHNHLDDTYDLYSPAPQAMMVESLARRFERVLERVEQDKVDGYLEKQRKFDPDIWIIETESGSGKLDLDFE